MADAHAGGDGRGDGEGPRPLVLVVDDDPTVHAALARALRWLGYDVILADSGADAYEQALAARPAVVLADVHMPGTDGHALLRRLTLSGVQSSVVLMSAHHELDDAIGAFREGAVDYLKKPWTLPDLKACLARAMDLYGAIRDLSAPVGQLSCDPLDDPTAEVTSESEGPMRALGQGAETQLPTSLEAADHITNLVNQMSSSGPLDLGDPSPTVVRLKQFAEGGTAVRWPETRALSLQVRQLFPVTHAALRVLNDRIWRFSVSRALAMLRVAQAAQVEVPLEPGRTFVGGLLLDVGASYLVARIAHQIRTPGSRVTDATLMTAAIAAHHGHVGSMILRHWKLPEGLSGLAEDHHGPAAGTPPLSPLRCAAALGGAVALRLAGFGDPTGDREMTPLALAQCAYALGVGDTVMRRLTRSLLESTEEIWAASS